MQMNADRLKVYAYSRVPRAAFWEMECNFLIALTVRRDVFMRTLLLMTLGEFEPVQGWRVAEMGSSLP